jgi:glycosyltransferase involved in cell wall biosynthesis
MVTYNTARYISRAIESVLSQTFKDFELLVIDDGSIDNTAEIVSKYEDPRLRYIYKEHENFASGMNRAIKEAQGQFIIGVDSDDFVPADYIQKLVNFAQENPSADYYYPRSFVLVDQNDQSINQWNYQIFSEGNEVAAYLFNQACSPIPNPGSLKRKELFSRTGLYESLETVEDFDFLCRNSTKIQFCRVDSSSPYYYRRLDTGNSHKYQTRNRIMASSLNEMVRLYNPLLLCPQLKNIKDESQQLSFYYKFLYETFTRHSRAPMVKYPQYFTTCANIYRNKLYELERVASQSSPAIADNKVEVNENLSDKEDLLADFREGVKLLRSGKPKDAMHCFDQVLKSGCDNGNLHYARAVAFVQLGDLASADLACRSGLKLRPDITQAKELLQRIQQYQNT